MKQIVFILTFLSILSCATKKSYVTEVKAQNIPINSQISEDKRIESYIKPFRDHIDTDLNAVLSYAPKTLDKSGTWQTPMGNLLADITLSLCDSIFQKKFNQKIDFCLLNHGGIRSTISAGNVTARNAYEIMPFENSAIVVGLNKKQVLDMVDYIIKEKKPHPINGITFTIDKNSQPKNIKINNKELKDDKIYYVVTSDYLANGGDNMLFLKESNLHYYLDYKLRNIIIDYFKKNQVIEANTNERISVE